MKCAATITIADREYRCRRPVGFHRGGQVPAPHTHHEWRRAHWTDDAHRAVITIAWKADVEWESRR